MSGGHYNRIYVKEPDQFMRQAVISDYFEQAAEEFRSKDFESIAEELEEADKRLEEIWEEVEEIRQDFKPLLKAMSWLKSGDYGEETFEEAVQRARNL